MIHTLASQYPITLLCDIARVSRSGYYAWKQAALSRARHAAEDEALVVAIETHARRYVGIYGYRRMTMHLQSCGYTVNHKRMARVMQTHGLQATIRRTRHHTCVLATHHQHATCPNLLGQQFTHTVVERVAGTDITYLWVPALQRFLYLSVVKDFASGEILAHRITTHLKQSLVLETIDQLVLRLETTTQDFLLHSDRGVHYTNRIYQQRLVSLGIRQSMSRKGNCLDNAATETFFGHLKDEVDLRTARTVAAATLEIADYIQYYNHTRRQWHRNKMTPVAYRDHLRAQAKA